MLGSWPAKKWGDLSTTPEGALSNTYRGEPQLAGTYPLTIPPREGGRSASIQLNYRNCRARFFRRQIIPDLRGMVYKRTRSPEVRLSLNHDAIGGILLSVCFGDTNAVAI